MGDKWRLEALRFEPCIDTCANAARRKRHYAASWLDAAPAYTKGTTMIWIVACPQRCSGGGRRQTSQQALQWHRSVSSRVSSHHRECDRRKTSQRVTSEICYYTGRGPIR